MYTSKLRKYERLTGPWTMLLVLLNVCSPALARDFTSLIPSSRWIILSSPFWPTSYEECNNLAQEFTQELDKLNAQHEECLQGTLSEPTGSAGCSKVSCQALHTARDLAGKKSSQEVAICRGKVSEHLAKQREEAQRRAQAAIEEERLEREHAREDAERKAEREADDLKDARDRKEKDAKTEQDRKERDARDEADKRERDARRSRERAEQDQKEKERQAAEDKAERVISARAQRESAVVRAREADAKRQSDAAEQLTYLELVNQLKVAKDAAVTALEFAANPFDKGSEMLVDAVASKLVEKGLDIAAPIGPEKKDPRYEGIANAVDEARQQMRKTNPFAEKISGLALEGVQKIHRQVLGQVDELGKQVEQFGQDDVARSNGNVSTYRPPMPSSSGSSAIRENPFAPGFGSNQVALSNGNVQEGSNPFDVETTTIAYHDPDTGRQYSIPSGHTLYRDPSSGELAVVAENKVQRTADDDQLVTGELRCSASGKGLVLSKCEKQRKTKNPFGAKAGQ